MSKYAQRQGEPHSPREPGAYLEKVREYQRLLISAGAMWDAGHSEQLAGLTLGADFPPGTIVLGGGMVQQVIHSSGFATVPHCALYEIDTPPHEFYPLVDFPTWWAVQNAVRHGQREWTRRFLVIEMANTDSIHIDDDLHDDYTVLRSPTMQIQEVTDGVAAPSPGVADQSMRQIAWELEMTLAFRLPE